MERERGKLLTQERSLSNLPSLHGVSIWIACLVVLCLGRWFQPPVSACGYHDPTTVRKGVLNWIYPNSLYVTGAIWRAQQEGKLPPPDTARITARGKRRQILDAMAYQKAERAIRALGAELGETTPDGRVGKFSIVLVETVLWTRFRLSSKHKLVAVDVGGPSDGDLVVVTGEPALFAMRNRTLPLSTAVESGFVRLYGRPEQVDDFLKTYGALGSPPTSNNFR